IRRLNRAEYNNTVRDLCGVDVKLGDDFPADDVGYGFDNIGDVLSFQPVLLEKFMSAADKVLTPALKIEPTVQLTKQGFKAQNLVVIPRSAKTQNPTKITFQSEGSGALERFNFPAEGEYIIRFQGWGSEVGDEYPQVTVRVGGKDVQTFTIDAE